MKERMKKLTSIRSMSVLALALLILFVPCANAVYIPDGNLEAAIREDLGIFPPDPITETDLAGLIYLYADGDGITDLTGLEYCVNLTELYLGDNNISDISALSGLTNLETLRLYYNNISYISALSGLTNLEELELGHNNISDISVLSGLTNLRFLWLYHNNISYISALSGLTNLRILSLDNNNISNISALSGLANLWGLVLGDNNISGISALSGLTNLEDLWLYHNNINDISALSGLTNLRWLDLGHNNISNISALSGLTNLWFLWLYHNNIGDIRALSGLTNLGFLWLYHNNIGDIQPLVDNPGLGLGGYADLTVNPLKNKAINKDIPILMARGVDVRFDELPESSVTIRGTVYEALTMDELSDVQVKADKKKILTDSNGKYVLAALPTGEIKITASKDGYYDETLILPYTLSSCGQWQGNPYCDAYLCDGPTGNIPLYMVPKQAVVIDTGFRPTRNGFHFQNKPEWSGCGGVPWTKGYCAGMAHAASNLWHEKILPNPKSDATDSWGWPIDPDAQVELILNLHQEFCGSDTLQAIIVELFSNPGPVDNFTMTVLGRLLRIDGPQPLVLGGIIDFLPRHHSVLAYKLVEIPTMRYVWIYDNNKAESERIIRFVKVTRFGRVYWDMETYDEVWEKFVLVPED